MTDHDEHPCMDRLRREDARLRARLMLCYAVAGWLALMAWLVASLCK